MELSPLLKGAPPGSPASQGCLIGGAKIVTPQTLFRRGASNCRSAELDVPAIDKSSHVHQQI